MLGGGLLGAGQTRSKEGVAVRRSVAPAIAGLGWCRGRGENAVSFAVTGE